MDDVGLEIGRPGLLTGVTQITNELERQATRSQERLDTTSLLAVQFTEDALRSLNSRYAIKITKPPSFDPTLVQASEQDLLRQRAQASDPEDTSTTSIRNRDRLRQSVIMTDEASGFSDPEFWGEFNVIEPEKPIENAIKKIQKQLEKIE